jgi:hypothetical protein
MSGFSPWTVPPLVDQGNAAITGGSIVGTNAPYFVAKSAIPFVKLSTGSIGNNGALTAITALPTTYANAYVWVPAGAIAAGVPAAATWYFAQFSSTTAATIFNNTYTTGIPTIPTSPTAFSTTGPGAFTGDTGTVTGPQYTLLGGAMGANGLWRAYEKWSATNNANAKSKNTTFGGSNLTGIISLASTVTWQDIQELQNRGTQATQIVGVNSTGATGIGSFGASVPIYRSIDTSANVTITRQMTAGTATDNVILESYADEVCFGA